MANTYNKNRKVQTFDQFLKNGKKSQKTSGTNVNGEAELTKKHYKGEKKGAKGIATITEKENKDTAAAVIADFKKIDLDDPNLDLSEITQRAFDLPADEFEKFIKMPEIDSQEDGWQWIDPRTNKPFGE